MGVRITFYALDLERVDEVAQMTLRDLLWFYSEQGCPEKLWIESADLRLYAKFGGVYLQKGQQACELTLGSAEEIISLSQTVRDFVVNEGAYWLKALLNCFALCDPVGWVCRVSDGHRRWWIGSFLNSVGEIHGASSAVYQRMVELFQTVLQGYDCGTEFPPQDSDAKSDLFFPLTANDPDLRMGFWTSEDVYFLLDIIRRIPPNTVFKPTLSYGIAPDSANDWNKWVWDVLEGLLVLQTLDYQKPSVVTFIG